MILLSVIGLDVGTGWICCGMLALLASALLIRQQHKSRRLREQNSRLKSMLHQKNELLDFSRENQEVIRKGALEIQASKSLLLTQISHNIRTPMTNVMGMTSLLGETQLDNEQREYLGGIQDSGENLLLLINQILMDDVLEYSRIDNERELDIGEMDLQVCIEEVFDVFAARAAHRNIDLVYQLLDQAPQKIGADRVRIQQILMNLIENALKFTWEGQVQVLAGLLGAEGDQQIRLGFEVRDSGIGMNAGTLKEIRDDKSSGLGLVISKKLISLMGGSLSVESVQNEGSAFKFSILARTVLSNQRRLQIPDFGALQVLLVDDNSFAARALGQRLEQLQMTVTTAGSAEKALNLLEQNPHFDLLLLDQEMPGMSGTRLAEKIRQMLPQSIIILLNRAGDEEHRKLPRLFQGVLGKPLRQHELNELMLAVVRQHRRQSMALTPTLAESPENPHDGVRKILDEAFARENPLKILLAEDDLMNQKMAMRILGKLGYEPKLAANGKEVLELVSDEEFDIILMDVQMPEMDGLEASKMIRACLTRQPVIIALTANTLQGDREACLNAGMDDYICKPVKLEELVNLLGKWAGHLNASR